MGEKYLTCREIAELLGVRPGTVRTWTSKGRIPFCRLAGGRAVRYRLSDIQQIAAPVNVCGREVTGANA